MSDLRARLDALPLDRAPLRRAGLLSALLVALLVGGKAFGPSRAAALAPAPRHDLQAPTEEVSAPDRPSGWTGGRVLALVLLAAGGAVAVALHRRRAPAALGAALDVIETHPLGPGHSLRLVGCGDEVLLLSVGGEGAQLLRHWPRGQFERDGVSLTTPTVRFSEALAEAGAHLGATGRLDGDGRPGPAAAEWLDVRSSDSPDGEAGPDGARPDDLRPEREPGDERGRPTGSPADSPAPEDVLEPSWTSGPVGRADGTSGVAQAPPSPDVAGREGAGDQGRTVFPSAGAHRGAPEGRPSAGEGALFPPATGRGLHQFGTADA